MNQHYQVLAGAHIRSFPASNAEEAALKMLEHLGQQSCSSIIVYDGQQRLDFLECRIEDGKLTFSERLKLS